MKISKAIEILQGFLTKYGDCELFFDCPKCMASYTPSTIEKQAIHLKSEK